MKNTLFIFIVLSLMSFSFPNVSSSDTANWKLYKEIDGLKIYSKQVSCKLEYTNKSNNYLLFKYENTNAQGIQISGRMDAWYNGNCRSCDIESPNEYEFNIELKAGESREGLCSDEQKAFKLFYSSDDNRIAPLDKFNVSNLIIKRE